MHDVEPPADVSTYLAGWPPMPITYLHRSSTQGELHRQLRPTVARARQREAHGGHVAAHTVGGARATMQDMHSARRIINQDGIA